MQNIKLYPNTIVIKDIDNSSLSVYFPGIKSDIKNLERHTITKRDKRAEKIRNNKKVHS